MGQVHLKGFSPVCSFMWLLSAHFSVKLRSHKWHVNFLQGGQKTRLSARPPGPRRRPARAPQRGGRGRGELQARSVMSV